MTTSAETAPAIPVEHHSRVSRIVCWAARLTSIPVFALLLVSLIPALSSFGVSARDDRVIAVGLCGIAAGFLTAWRWPGIGGLVTLLSVGVIVSQEDGFLLADPFSVAFALQGILFLISWVLNFSRTPKEMATTSTPWLKGVAVGLLAIAAVGGSLIILRGPGPTPVSRENQPYVGIWENGTGFTMEITSEGRARISHDKNAKVEPCNTPVPPGGSSEFLVEFRDDRLELSGGVLGQTKTYHIDRRPFPQAKQVKMVLNGSDPYKRSSGMILLKKQAGGTETNKAAGKVRS